MVCLYPRLPLISSILKTVAVTSSRNMLQVTVLSVNTIRHVNEGTISNEATDDTMAWELLVDYTKLSQKDIKIHQRHADAVRNKKLTYIDPSTGYIVMTRLSHIKRGECCGNACRHCPYGQKSVPDNQKKTFNSAFYI